MSRSVSTFTVAVLIFTLFTILTSAAPIGTDCDTPDVKGFPVPATPSPTPTPTPSPANSTSSTDTSNDNSDVVNPATVNTLATTGSTYGGTATWFEVGLGACGQTNSDTDMIVALAEADWDGGSHCGKTLQITNSGNKKTHSATVVDLCTGCGEGSLDMSPSLFEALDGSLDYGTFLMTWAYS